MIKLQIYGLLEFLNVTYMIQIIYKYISYFIFIIYYIHIINKKYITYNVLYIINIH